MIELRGPKGLGDAIYLRSIALHVLDRGEEVSVFTQWPEVFAGLPVTIRSQTESPDPEALRSAFYCLFCRIPGPKSLDQYSMMCAQVGLPEPAPLRLGWTVRNRALVDRIARMAGERKILLFQPPKAANGPEQEMLRPRESAFNAALARHDGYFKVRVGCSKYLQPSAAPCDLDLLDQTSVSDLLDLATVADLFFGDSCALLVMADALEKPSVYVMTRRSLKSAQQRVCNQTGDRLFHRSHLVTTVYDEEN